MCQAYYGLSKDHEIRECYEKIPWQILDLPGDLYWVVLYLKIRIADASSSRDQGDQEEDNKDKEKDLGDTGRTGGDTEETEGARYQRDDQEYNCPT